MEGVLTMVCESHDDLRERTRRDLALLCSAVTGKKHWVFLTDDPAAARVLRLAAAGALYVEAVVTITSTGDAFRCAALAVPKGLWPPSEARRVAAAAAAGRARLPDVDLFRGGTNLFPISRRPERITAFLAQIFAGTVTADPPPGTGGAPAP
jgi:hypothetical protein